MNTVTHPMTEDYLRRFDRAARVLPAGQRAELLAEIGSHIDAGLPPNPTEADVRNLLEELGSPEQIVAAARPEGAPPPRRGAREAFALILLVLGLPPILGWIVGAALLLWSPLWSGWQKLLGLLVWPGGLFTVLGASAFFVAASGNSTCGVGPQPDVSPSAAGSLSVATACPESHSWPYTGVVIVGFIVVAQLLVAGYLYRAAGRPQDAS